MGPTKDGYMEYLDKLERQSYDTHPTVEDRECNHGHKGYYGLNANGDPICLKCQRIRNQKHNAKRKSTAKDRKYHQWGDSLVSGSRRKTSNEFEEWLVNRGQKVKATVDFDARKVTLECHDVGKWFTDDDPDWVEGRDYVRQGAEQYLDELDRKDNENERRDNFDSEEPYWGSD